MDSEERKCTYPRIDWSRVYLIDRDKMDLKGKIDPPSEEEVDQKSIKAKFDEIFESGMGDYYEAKLTEALRKRDKERGDIVCDYKNPEECESCGG